MDVFLLPFIFSFRAAISFLLLLQASLSRCNILWFVRFLFGTISQVFQATIQWIGFLFWLFVSSYTGRFWIQVLWWLFTVPIIFVTLFQYVYNFGPKHCKRSLLDILFNPVPGIEFDGRIGESEDFASLERHQLLDTSICQLKERLGAQCHHSQLSNGSYQCNGSNSFGISDVCNVSQCFYGGHRPRFQFKHANDSLLCDLQVFVPCNCLFISPKTTTGWNIHGFHHFGLHRIHFWSHDYLRMLQTQFLLSTELFSV
jgi:hypothetical protein